MCQGKPVVCLVGHAYLLVLRTGCCKLVHHVFHTEAHFTVVAVEVLPEEVITCRINNHLPARATPQSHTPHFRLCAAVA